jgi:hypothetical protein
MAHSLLPGLLFETYRGWALLSQRVARPSRALTKMLPNIIHIESLAMSSIASSDASSVALQTAIRPTSEGVTNLIDQNHG